MQGRPDLSPAQKEDQTYKPIKWLILKLNILNIGQLQVHTCGAVYVQWRRKEQLQNFSAQIEKSACV
jgi:hypothetical protein